MAFKYTAPLRGIFYIERPVRVKGAKLDDTDQAGSEAAPNPAAAANSRRAAARRGGFSRSCGAAVCAAVLRLRWAKVLLHIGTCLPAWLGTYIHTYRP
jgi:hypothetical protein